MSFDMFFPCFRPGCFKLISNDKTFDSSRILGRKVFVTDQLQCAEEGRSRFQVLQFSMLTGVRIVHRGSLL